MNDYDQLCRSLVARSDPLLCWFAKMRPEQMRRVEWLETKLTAPGAPERISDLIASVSRQDRGGEPWAVLLAFQAEPDPLMFGRMLVEMGLFWQLAKSGDNPGDRYRLLGIVVNLSGTGRCALSMEWSPGAGVTLGAIEWNMADRDAAATLDEIEAGRAPLDLLGWISLMKRAAEPGIIERWLELVQLVADERTRSIYAWAVRIFARKGGGQEAWEKALEGYMETKLDILDPFRAEGRAESVIVLLRDRFTPPGELLARIRATPDSNTLDRWLLLAAKADSLDAFRRDAGL